MRRTLLRVVAAVFLAAFSFPALADSTVPALSAGTSLTTAVMYAANAGANDNKLGFTTTVFDIATGALTLKASGVTNAMLANSATTVLGTVCTLGSTCTPSVPAASVTAGALANGMTATTQTLGDNSTKLATTAFVIANAGGGGGTPGGTSGQNQYNNAGSFGGYTMGGDATINTTTGVLTITSNAITTTKINNAAITLAKQATNTANTLQGFDNSGNAADVLVGSGLSLSAGTLTSTGAVGNPTATAGPTAINGSASTAMRSDGAPAIQKGTNAQFGIVEGDNATITCVLGVCSTIGGGSAGGGVDGGTNFVTVTGTGAISGTPNLVYIGSGWTTGTLTLPQISALANKNDHLVCVDDSKNFVDGTHTLTVIPNATTPDTIANASTTGAMITSGLSICFRPNNTTHNWTVESSVAIPAPTNGTILTGLCGRWRVCQNNRQRHGGNGNERDHLGGLCIGRDGISHGHGNDRCADGLVQWRSDWGNWLCAARRRDVDDHLLPDHEHGEFQGLQQHK